MEIYTVGENGTRKRERILCVGNSIIRPSSFPLLGVVEVEALDLGCSPWGVQAAAHRKSHSHCWRSEVPQALGMWLHPWVGPAPGSFLCDSHLGHQLHCLISHFRKEEVVQQKALTVTMVTRCSG